MPGSIRVSVLEAVDLPEAFTGDHVGPVGGVPGMDVAVKVTLGQREYTTVPGIADEGRTAPWNSDFAFPVTNLRDKLVVALCNKEEQSLTKTAIAIPSIIERGFRDEFVGLDCGGQIHLKMSFVLTDEERKKIEMMRVAALKRREEERLKNTVVFQTVQPVLDSNAAVPPVSRVTITEVDSTMDQNDHPSKENSNAPLGFGLTKPLKPKPLFDYARAVGLKSSRNIKRKTERRTMVGVSAPLSKIVKIDSAEVHSVKLPVGDSGQSLGKCGSGVLPESKESPTSSPPTTMQKDIATANVPPSAQGPFVGPVTTGNVKAQVDALEGTLPQELDDNMVPTERQEDQWRAEGQRAQDLLEAEATAMAMSLEERSTVQDEQREKRNPNRGHLQMRSKEQMQRLGGVQGSQRAGSRQREPETSESREYFSRQKFTDEVRGAPGRSPGQPILVSELRQLASSEPQEADEKQRNHGMTFRSESRSGPGARWAQKTSVENRWASPEKTRRMVRDDWSQSTDPFKARVKILEQFKAAEASDEYGNEQSLQERQSLSGSIGVVINKVVGGAAMLLAALFMLWPLGEGPDRTSEPSADDRLLTPRTGNRGDESAISNP